MGSQDGEFLQPLEAGQAVVQTEAVLVALENVVVVVVVAVVVIVVVELLRVGGCVQQLRLKPDRVLAARGHLVSTAPQRFPSASFRCLAGRGSHTHTHKQQSLTN